MSRVRLLYVVSALTTLALLLSACSCPTAEPTAAPPTEAPTEPPTEAPTQAPTEASTEPPAEEVVVKVLSMDQAGYPPDVMDEIARRFSEANAGVTVEVTYLAYDEIYDKLVTAVAAGGEPPYDVVLVDQPWVAQFVEAGWLLDITDRVPDEYREGIFASAWNVTTVGDRVYGAPWMIDTKMFFYNRQLLEAAGYDAPPATWEELEEMALAMKDQGLIEYPVIWSWAQAEAVICDFVVLLSSNNGRFFDGETPVFNDERGVEVLTWMVESIEKGVSNPSSIASVESDVENVFLQGEAAFALNWPYMYGLAQFDETVSQVLGQVGVAPIPVFERARAEGLETATVDGSMAFGLADGSPHPDEAWAFVEFLVSKPIQMEFSAFLPPVWQSAYEQPDLAVLLAQNPANEVLMPAFSHQFQSAVTRPKVPYYAEVSITLQLALQEALGGVKAPADALNEAAETIGDIQ